MSGITDTERDAMDKDKGLLQQKLHEIRAKWDSRGWATQWCDPCGGLTIICPECGKNVCGLGTKDCGTCAVARPHNEEMMAETDPIIQEM